MNGFEYYEIIKTFRKNKSYFYYKIKHFNAKKFKDYKNYKVVIQYFENISNQVKVKISRHKQKLLTTNFKHFSVSETKYVSLFDLI